MESIQRYLVVKHISSGAFSSVYLGRDAASADAPLVALKLLHPETSRIAENVQLLRDEGRLLQLLKHPRVVTCFNSIQLVGRPCLVLEFIEGPPLNALIHDSTLPIKVALYLVGQVAQTLHDCYVMIGPESRQVRLIHRDIKPANIVLTRDGLPKLIDFGIAQAVFADRVALSLESHLGTASYMSPERFEMLDGPAGDVYSLGAMLVTLLSGVPIGKTSPNQKKHQIKIRGALNQLEQKRPISAALRGLLEQTLDFDPDTRPSPQSLAESLINLAAQETTPPQPAKDWLSQHLKDYAPPEPAFIDPLVGTILAPTLDFVPDIPDFIEAPTGEYSPVFTQETPPFTLDEEASDYWEVDDFERIRFDETEESPSEGPGVALPSFDGPWTDRPASGEYKQPSREDENPRVGRFLLFMLLVSVGLATCMSLS